MPERISLPGYQGYFASRRWVWWRNKSSTVCPAFGLIDRATTYEGAYVKLGVGTLSRGERLIVETHDSQGFQGDALSTFSLSDLNATRELGADAWQGEGFAANSNIAVQPGALGLATFDWPLLTLKHPGSPKILAGERCSPKSGSWEVTRELQDETTTWVGRGPELGAQRYDSGRQFVCLGVQREPRINGHEVLLISPWRSPQEDLLCVVKDTDTRTLVTESGGDVFDVEAAHFKAPATFGLRVPASPRSGVVSEDDSGSIVVSKLSVTEAGLYDGVFQATVGMVRKSTYGYGGDPPNASYLRVGVYRRLLEGGGGWEDFDYDGGFNLFPSKSTTLDGEQYRVAEMLVRFSDDLVGSASVDSPAPFNEDRKRSIYLPFSLRVFREAELSVRIRIAGNEIGDAFFTATVDDPALLLEYAGPRNDTKSTVFT